MLIRNSSHCEFVTATEKGKFAQRLRFSRIRYQNTSKKTEEKRTNLRLSFYLKKIDVLGSLELFLKLKNLYKPLK